MTKEQYLNAKKALQQKNPKYSDWFQILDGCDNSLNKTTDYYSGLVDFYKQVFMCGWHPKNFKDVLLEHTEQRYNKKELNDVEPKW